MTCVKQAGKINIGSGSTGGQQALAVVMAEGNPPDGRVAGAGRRRQRLSVADSMGAKVGSAKVAVDGKTYTISGQAQGADLKNPMAGMITKDFSIKVSCG